MTSFTLGNTPVSISLFKFLPIVRFSHFLKILSAIYNVSFPSLKTILLNGTLLNASSYIIFIEEGISREVIFVDEKAPFFIILQPKWKKLLF